MSVSNSASRPQSQQASSTPAPLASSTSLTNASSSRPASSGLRVPSNRKTIYDRHLNRSRNAELSRASFAFIFGEMITYAQKRVTGITDLERRLNVQGYPIGLKMLDLLLYRSPTPFASNSNAANSLRPTHILPLLQFISTSLWKHLFGRPADALERSQDNADEYMITDNDPVVSTYISVPKEMSQLNCAAFVAGIIEGVCDGCAFFARVTAHTVGDGDGDDEGSQAPQMWPGKTVFLVKFREDVMEREAILSRGK